MYYFLRMMYYHIFCFPPLKSILGVEEVNFDLQVPLNSKADVIKQFETAINENKGIKVAIIDHITSPSALLLPVKELIEVCHKNGIIAIIDGAHAPGHIPLNLEELNADYYTGEYSIHRGSINYAIRCKSGSQHGVAWALQRMIIVIQILCSSLFWTLSCIKNSVSCVQKTGKHLSLHMKKVWNFSKQT